MPKTTLSKRQWEQLAEALKGTTHDPQTIASTLFNVIPDPVIAVQNLDSYGQIFQCYRCKHWKSVDDESVSDDVCEQCFGSSSIDGDEFDIDLESDHSEEFFDKVLDDESE